MHKLRLLDSMMNFEQVQRVLQTTTHTTLQPATVPITVTTTVTPQRVSERYKKKTTTATQMLYSGKWYTTTNYLETGKNSSQK